jgi:hypothetical protein
MDAIVWMIVSAVCLPVAIVATAYAWKMEQESRAWREYAAEVANDPHHLIDHPDAGHPTAESVDIATILREQRELTIGIIEALRDEPGGVGPSTPTISALVEDDGDDAVDKEWYPDPTDEWGLGEHGNPYTPRHPDLTDDEMGE